MTKKKTGKAKTRAKTKEQQICCDEVMDIASMAEFRPQLMAALKSKQAVELDASQVKRADTAALQLLSAFIQDANAQQQTVHWKEPSEALCDSAALLGLSELLSLEVNTGI